VGDGSPETTSDGDGLADVASFAVELPMTSLLSVDGGMEAASLGVELLTELALCGDAARELASFDGAGANVRTAGRVAHLHPAALDCETVGGLTWERQCPGVGKAT
jgi:hypothetical protein